ncbi:tRNA glutamyl-Q(34) synthetase GluQRS [Methylovirgula sp. HY1]|uniref:tRNA glutamyl-Q(34) synthetase GluQRS n=1 Tax=Methylovirgula sp. HY1 TaxID=2822761 RepID=UPI001C5BF4F5|nr:tRNA glutamyl-Q(34) synthetase GluQRS [Methylovirgula sp. HY1]QXX75050.1 Glutamate--tRNA ligase [Methylovirgula sp. HY1]
MTRTYLSHIFRFAPSPNGYLHLGHAYSALINHEMAQTSGGSLLLRIEDIDIARCRPEFEQAIYEDLRWLGLSWEEPVRRQSEHFDAYAQALTRLEQQGLVYPCFCSRGEVAGVLSAHPDWPRDPDGSPLYPGTCKHLSPSERRARLAAGQPAALRLDMEAGLAAVNARLGQKIGWQEYGSGMQGREVSAEPVLWGDAVLSRKDIPASYHIAVVVDDALQGVTDVVRGEDLFMATGLHRLLQILLELPAPCYHHHELLRDAAGRKLSKSLRAKSLRTLRHEGMTPDEVKAQFGLLRRNFAFVP